MWRIETIDMKPKYKRVLLKLSGEAFLGELEYGIDPKFISRLTSEIGEVAETGAELAIVVGGGNIFRGAPAEKHGMDRATGDYIGMLATVMNSLALRDSFQKKGIEARMMSALQMPKVCEFYTHDRAIYQLAKGRIVIIAAGTGSPFQTTDTAAALRALELNCNAVLKATIVDGVYDCDPKINQNAAKYDNLSHRQALTDGLKVMDATALSMCMEHKLPIIVFNLLEHGNIKKVISSENIGTLVF